MSASTSTSLSGFPACARSCQPEKSSSCPSLRQASSKAGKGVATNVLKTLVSFKWARTSSKHPVLPLALHFLVWLSGSLTFALAARVVVKLPWLLRQPLCALATTDEASSVCGCHFLLEKLTAHPSMGAALVTLPSSRLTRSLGQRLARALTKPLLGGPARGWSSASDCPRTLRANFLKSDPLPL